MTVGLPGYSNMVVTPTHDPSTRAGSSAGVTTQRRQNSYYEGHVEGFRARSIHLLVLTTSACCEIIHACTAGHSLP